MAMTRNYVDMVRENAKIGEKVRWADYPEVYVSNKSALKTHEATVVKKCPNICVTDKGAVQWSLIAIYLWRIENGDG